MTLRDSAVVLGLVSFVGLGCPPSLTGESCDDDCACPTGQTCTGRTCQAGTNVCGQTPDGGPDAGADAGADGGGLSGVVTLNGGAALPAGNAAWIYAYTSLGVVDGGTPVLTATVQDGGAFDLNGAQPGINYYLLAQYDITHDGVPGQNDKIWVGGPFQTTNSPVSIDIPTYACTVLTLEQAGTPGAYFGLAVADLPNIQTGQELSSGVTASVSGTTLGTQGLNIDTTQTDPISYGKWSYVDMNNAKINADTTYTFTISAPPDYSSITCTVSLGAETADPGPTLAITFDGGTDTSTWNRTGFDTVSWSNVAPDLTEEFVELRDGLGAVVAASSVLVGAPSYTFVGSALGLLPLCPKGPANGQCSCDTVFGIINTTGPAVWLEGLVSTTKFQTIN